MRVHDEASGIDVVVSQRPFGAKQYLTKAQAHIDAQIIVRRIAEIQTEADPDGQRFLITHEAVPHAEGRGFALKLRQNGVETFVKPWRPF